MLMLMIKYYERFSLNVPGVPDAWPKWAKVTVATVKENYKPVTRLRIKNITREEAVHLIQERGLVQVHRDTNGKVYDTPDKSFQSKYKGMPIPYIV